MLDHARQGNVAAQGVAGARCESCVIGVVGTSRMREMDKAEIARQLRQRRDATTWWAAQVSDHPFGLVPFNTASRVLDISPTRLRHLIEEGRVRLVEGMPGGNVRDKFIPFVDLLAAPSLVEAGRIGVYGPENRVARKPDQKSRKKSGR